MSKYQVKINGKELSVELLERSGSGVKFKIGEKIHEVNLRMSEKNSSSSSADNSKQTIQSGPKQIVSPMPGLVVKLLVKEGDSVTANQALLTIEAMKMENSISSPGAGKVEKIHVSAGQEVSNKQLLITLA